MEYKLIHHIKDLPNFSLNSPIFADIETDGLYGALRMIQLYQPTISKYVYILDVAPIGYNRDNYYSALIDVEDLLMRYHTVWFNASYDLGTLNISPSMGIKHPDEVSKSTKYCKKVDDLFYAVKTAYPEFMEFGLKKIVRKLSYTKGLYSGIETKEAAKGFVRGAYLSQQAYKYAALDVYALGLMWEDKKIQNVIQNNTAYEVDMISMAYALIYQQNGLLLDRDTWKEALTLASRERDHWATLLPEGLNVNSYKQVRAYLDTTESDAAALISYALSDKPLASKAEAILQLKRFKKEVSYLNSINFDTMITKYNVAGAISGRFTAKGGGLENGFNAQQIPRKFQSLFNCDTENTTAIGLDYSTLELRLACELFGNKKMHEQLLNGEDLHTAMAIFTSGKELHKDGLVDDEIIDNGHQIKNPLKDKYVSFLDRFNAKGINFGYVFGMSAKAFVEYAFTRFGIKISLQQSIRLRNAYFKLYPEFAVVHNYMWNNYKKPRFYVTTALGRKVKPKLGTDAINIPVQGTGAETTKLGVHYMVKENPMVLKYIYNVVHDATYTRVPKDEAKYWEDLQRRGMLKGWTEIRKTSVFKFGDTPMSVD